MGAIGRLMEYSWTSQWVQLIEMGKLDNMNSPSILRKGADWCAGFFESVERCFACLTVSMGAIGRLMEYSWTSQWVQLDVGRLMEYSWRGVSMGAIGRWSWTSHGV